MKIVRLHQDHRQPKKAMPETVKELASELKLDLTELDSEEAVELYRDRIEAIKQEDPSWSPLKDEH